MSTSRLGTRESGCAVWNLNAWPSAQFRGMRAGRAGDRLSQCPSGIAERSRRGGGRKEPKLKSHPSASTPHLHHHRPTARRSADHSPQLDRVGRRRLGHRRDPPQDGEVLGVVAVAAAGVGDKVVVAREGAHGVGH